MVVLGILFIGIIYYSLENLINSFVIFKKRKKDYSFNLILLIALGLLWGSIIIFSYFDFFSILFCFLYPIAFLVIILAMILFWENLREERINNIAWVLGRVERSNGFDIKDLIIPNMSFTAKLILKYGHKKAARMSLIVGIVIFIVFLYLAPAYIEHLDSTFYIFWIISFSIFSFFGYRRTTKDYRSALMRFKKGSCKKDHKAF